MTDLLGVYCFRNLSLYDFELPTKFVIKKKIRSTEKTDDTVWFQNFITIFEFFFLNKSI